MKAMESVLYNWEGPSCLESQLWGSGDTTTEGQALPMSFQDRESILDCNMEFKAEFKDYFYKAYF